MKKFLFIIFILSSFLSFTQDSTDVNIQDYPKPYIVGGDTVGGILTIDQLHKIDKDQQLLEMYRDLLSSYQESDEFCIKIVDEYEDKISILNIKIEELQNIIGDKDMIISNLKDKVILYESNEGKYEEKLTNKDNIINEQGEQIKKQRNKMIWGGIAAGVTIVIVTVLSIF